MKKLLVVMAVFTLLVAVLVWRNSHHSGEIGTDLLFGWTAFLWRVLPDVRIQWEGVAIFAGASLALIVVLHSFLSWLTAAIASPEVDRKPRWPCKWTFALTAGILAIFVAGISVVGVTHQSYWLATSNEPLYGQDLPKWRRGYSINNLKQTALSVYNTVDSERAFPSQWRSNVPNHSWVTQILPYVSYIDEIDRSLEWNNPKNVPRFRAVIPMFCNPQLRTPPFRDQNGFGLNHYAGNTHLFDRTDRFTINDFDEKSTANTLMIGEVNAQFVPWGQPENSRDPQKGIGIPEGFGGASGSPGANFAMLDGSVRLIRKDIDPKVLSALSKPVKAK
jgi:prepilin-type processing-associated H-X9-DG protein